MLKHSRKNEVMTKVLDIGSLCFYFILLFYFSGLKFSVSGLYQISRLLLFSAALPSHPLFQNHKDTEKKMAVSVLSFSLPTIYAFYEYACVCLSGESGKCACMGLGCLGSRV